MIMLSRHMNELHHQQPKPVLKRRTVWKKVVSTFNCYRHCRSNTYQVNDPYDVTKDKQGNLPSPLATRSVKSKRGSKTTKSPRKSCNSGISAKSVKLLPEKSKQTPKVKFIAEGKAPSLHKVSKLEKAFPQCEILSQRDLEHVIHPVSNKPITLGRGGYGVVKLMKNTKNGKFCAVKTYQEHLNTTKIFREAKLEVQMLNELRGLHCVPTLYGIVPAEGRAGVPSIVQEYIGDEQTFKTWTLQAALKRNTISVSAKFRIALNIAKAMIDLHSKGVLHCDLKADNIMLSPGFEVQRDPQIKIIDFGKALKMNEKPKFEHLKPAKQQRVLTRSIHIDPEVVLGSMPYNARSEVYSLGLVFVTMASGQHNYLKYLGDRCMDKNLVQRPKMDNIKERLTLFIDTKKY